MLPDYTDYVHLCTLWLTPESSEALITVALRKQRARWGFCASRSTSKTVQVFTWYLTFSREKEVACVVCQYIINICILHITVYLLYADSRYVQISTRLSVYVDIIMYSRVFSVIPLWGKKGKHSLFVDVNIKINFIIYDVITLSVNIIIT